MGPNAEVAARLYLAGKDRKGPYSQKELLKAADELFARVCARLPETLSCGDTSFRPHNMLDWRTFEGASCMWVEALQT